MIVIHETIWRRSGVVFSLSLRLWAEIQDSVSNTCVCYLQIGFPPLCSPRAYKRLLYLARTKCMQIAPSPASLWQTHSHCTCVQMHACMQTSPSYAQDFVDTHGKTSHTLWLPRLIPALVLAPWKTFTLLQHKVRTLWFEWWWLLWWWWWWPHLLCLISLLSQTALHKLPAGWLRPSAKLMCNLKHKYWIIMKPCCQC